MPLIYQDAKVVTEVTKLRNEIKHLNSESDELKKEDYEKYNIMKGLRNTALWIVETGWQTEYRISRYISSQNKSPLKTCNIYIDISAKSFQYIIPFFGCDFLQIFITTL